MSVGHGSLYRNAIWRVREDINDKWQEAELASKKLTNRGTLRARTYKQISAVLLEMKNVADSAKDELDVVVEVPNVAVPTIPPFRGLTKTGQVAFAYACNGEWDHRSLTPGIKAVLEKNGFIVNQTDKWHVPLDLRKEWKKWVSLHERRTANEE